MTVARVTLRGASTYKFKGMSWQRNNPKIIKGAAVKDFQNNGYFDVRIIKQEKPTKAEAAPVIESSSLPEPQGNGIGEDEDFGGDDGASVEEL